MTELGGPYELLPAGTQVLPPAADDMPPIPSTGDDLDTAIARL